MGCFNLVAIVDNTAINIGVEILYLFLCFIVVFHVALNAFQEVQDADSAIVILVVLLEAAFQNKYFR